MGDTMTGEATSISALMKNYHLQCERMSLTNMTDMKARPAEYNAIVGDFNAAVDAVCGDIVCSDVGDLLTVLHYVKAEFDGDDCMADSLLPAAIKWLSNPYIQASLDVATIADDHLRLVESKREAQRVLSEAYRDFRQSFNLDRIDRDSTMWLMMMNSTNKQYRALVEAKRLARNGKRRLERAVLALRKSFSGIAE